MEKMEKLEEDKLADADNADWRDRFSRGGEKWTTRFPEITRFKLEIKLNPRLSRNSAP